MKDFFYLLFLLLGLTFPLVYSILEESKTGDCGGSVFSLVIAIFFLCGLISGGMESVKLA